ncbi:hypothetical protein PACTADRAFT_272 [Pachysolen tannophilus NRRL Y-2460]|uniref:Uncharacterized protein n=1 Tax=Pachysolen tannophilus NRRL Y-2460 TaxID=669874 RepID=A0A1E4U1A7_PACTA|nr:hypothetical protein PACTADRAFT_272 [Pachysolen tannophilus NRRL Y-2460]
MVMVIESCSSFESFVSDFVCSEDFVPTVILVFGNGDSDNDFNRDEEGRLKLSNVREITNFSKITIITVDSPKKCENILVYLNCISSARRILFFNFLSSFINQDGVIPIKCLNIRFLSTILNFFQKQNRGGFLVESYKPSFYQDHYLPVRQYVDPDLFAKENENEALRDKEWFEMYKYLIKAGYEFR